MGSMVEHVEVLRKVGALITEPATVIVGVTAVILSSCEGALSKADTLLGSGEKTGTPPSEVEKIRTPPSEVEVHLTTLRYPLSQEFHDVLVPFLATHSSMLLSTTPFHRSSAYAVLGEFLLLLTQNSMRTLASPSRAEFSSLLATLRDFTFNSSWLDEMECKILSPSEDSPLKSLARIVLERETIDAEANCVAMKIARLKESLSTLEASHHSLLEKRSVLVDEESRLIAIVDAPFLDLL